MALGIPVASTTAGGLGEMLGGGAGLLVPAADPEALAEAVARILGDRSLRSALVARAAETVRAFHRGAHGRGGPERCIVPASHNFDG